ncbi:hypothetical protein HPT27_06580 [Permianibacter sp. IMCC34836]|uniref:hypothetical protein n=1 Tax=Permianibacter fluminis TaxID=2738515 RepID=UPI001555AB7D|nr:hypothetical protein [Permianibacter fluminis]NQD36685.1 hypothetical protein [Permianibacter fluminis]
MGRSILAVFAGLLMGAMVTALIEWAGYQLYPVPIGLADVDAAMADYLRNAPAGSVLMSLAWFFGGCDGALIAAWWAPQQPWRHGFIVVAILLLVAALMLLQVAHPAWLNWAAPLTYFVAGLVGCKVGSMLHDKRRAGIAR